MVRCGVVELVDAGHRAAGGGGGNFPSFLARSTDAALYPSTSFFFFWNEYMGEVNDGGVGGGGVGMV